MHKQLNRRLITTDMGTDRIAQLELFLREDPEDTFVLFALAKEYASVDNYEQAKTYYGRLRSVDPDYIGLYYHLGKLEEKAGNISAARQVYLEGVHIARRLADGHALSELQAALDLLGA